jgi:quercetin dioxygenase-like cupin family protein
MRTRTVISACLLSFLAGAGGMWAQQERAVTRREPQFENEHVKVWKSIIEPKQPLTMHRHEHGRTAVALTDGHLNVIDANGKTVGRYEWKKGKAYWLDADKPGELHGDRNDTDKPIEVIIVEMKR